MLRLTLLAHAMTGATAAARFPADEDLSAVGRHQLSARAGLAVTAGRAVQVWCGPELRARQTAAALGLTPTVQSALADLDHGSWAGRPLADLPPAELTAWMTDPGAAPHGGESLLDLLDRVRRWLDGLPAGQGSAGWGRVLAVTHPAVIRAAILVVLAAPPQMFWRVDVAPAATVTLHHRGGAWTLRAGDPS